MLMFFTNGSYYSNSEIDAPMSEIGIFVTSAGHHTLVKKPHFDTVRPNGRKDYQILYVNKGKIYYTVEDTQYICDENCILLYKPYEPQFYTYRLEDSPDIYWMHFTGNAVDRILHNLHLDENQCQTVKSETDLTQYFNNIISEFQIKSFNYAEIANLNFRLLLNLFSRGAKEVYTSKTQSFDEVNNAVTYFNNHFADNISIVEYAKSQNISIGWFTKLFRQQLNTTPHKYLVDLRIEKSKSLLISDMPISEVAFNVGFTDPLYFSRAFHKATGMSPIQYRKQNAGVVAMDEREAPWITD